MHRTSAKCSNCGKRQSDNVAILRCSQCKSVWYCDKKCQKENWKSHRKMCAKKYFVRVSSERPIRAGRGFGEVTVNGPFHLGDLNEFLRRNFLTRDDTVVNAITREEFTHTDGEVFDSHTGGFGGVVIETDSTGEKYIGDGWNATDVLLGDTVASIGTMNQVPIHAWCVVESGKVYDYDDRMLMQTCFYWSEEVVRIPVNDEETPLLMGLFQGIVDLWFESSGKTLEEHVIDIRNGTFPSHRAMHRAMLLKKSDPAKYTVMIGSYGFRQADGVNIFFVWG